ncbi:MAG: gfo/Idh/MocA family oxidoreductase, partial [Acidobacteriota bacterium]
CIHMLDTVRWMLDLGWPKTISSNGGILIQKQSKANIPDTQTATFDFGDFPVVWQHRTYGTPPDPKYPWGLTIYGEKGTLKASVMSYDFIPVDKNEQPIHKDVTYEFEQYPEDRTEKDLERHVAPAIRGHMRDLLRSIEKRSKPVADIEQGHISTASCILANHALTLGRTLAWDPVKQVVSGDPAANRLLARPYRKPWVHPKP